ncbi:hypothetical protein CFK37_07310 [Virgibacillus phasianinus]|uniref:DUF1428 domain-containing protein n=1 Tax=Virgibacillus phasianinus TaxID=2017483 RepID=A0A220U1M1_9BACI|nr:DUF1428 family protein [Virgibacillus phasianinus]ASK61980.1 hypothetical protein CFK37_07310 [Virgibacillus phasianinus]
MYTTIYIYRVKRENVESFLDINEKASEIYLANGALEDNTYLADDISGDHGCSGLVDLIDIKDNEVVLFGQTVFRNKSHCEAVMKLVNDDEEINKLFNDMTEIIDLSKVVTASFIKAVN